MKKESTNITPEKPDIPSAPKESYNTVGFHRLLGGFYYNMVLFLFGTVVLIAMLAVVIPIVLPYPEIEGYAKIVYGLLGFAFGIFDLGSTRSSTDPNMSSQLSDGLLKYIGDYATVDPPTAMKYIRFFCWFQMVTGLIQVTLISCVALWWFPFTNMAHLTWFILGYTLIQFPGCTSIYESVLKGFQQLDVLAKYQFIKDTFIKYGTMATGVIIGRNIGAQSPQIGELMGATIGYILALYFAEIITFIMGTIMFRQRVGKRIHFGSFEIFRPCFEKKVMTETLSFSFKLWIGNLFGQLLGLITNLVIIDQIPSYGLWVGLISVGTQFSGFVSMQGQMSRNSTSPLAEAYNNKKYDLFRFYIINIFKYNGFITGYLFVPMLIFFPRMLGEIVELVPGLGSYAPIVLILPLLIIKDALTNSIGSLSGRLFNAANRPMTGVIIGIILSPLNLIFTLLFLRMGMTYEVLIWAPFLGSIISIIVQFWYFNRKIMPLHLGIKNNIWHQIVAPIIMILVGWGIFTLIDIGIVTPTLDLLTPFFWAPFLIIGALMLFPIIIFTPIYAFLGGIDDNTLSMMKEAAPLAGFSSWILNGIIRVASLVKRISPLGNRFPLPLYDEAERERLDLNKNNRLID
jgi:hypothetical protein